MFPCLYVSCFAPCICPCRFRNYRVLLWYICFCLMQQAAVFSSSLSRVIYEGFWHQGQLAFLLVPGTWAPWLKLPLCCFHMVQVSVFLGYSGSPYQPVSPCWTCLCHVHSVCVQVCSGLIIWFVSRVGAACSLASWCLRWCIGRITAYWSIDNGPYPQWGSGQCVISGRTSRQAVGFDLPCRACARASFGDRLVARQLARGPGSTRPPLHARVCAPYARSGAT